MLHFTFSSSSQVKNVHCFLVQKYLLLISLFERSRKIFYQLTISVLNIAYSVDTSIVIIPKSKTLAPYLYINHHITHPESK